MLLASFREVIVRGCINAINQFPTQSTPQVP